MDVLTDDHEREEAVRKWWREYWKPIALGVTIALAGLVGFRQYQAWQLGQAQEASYQLFQAQSALNRAGIDGTGAAETYINAHPDIYGALLSLDVARLKSKAGQYADAAKNLEFAKAHGGNMLQPVIELTRGRIQAQQGQPDAALTTLRAITSEAYTVEVNEAIGDVCLQKQDRACAREAYKTALDTALARKLPVSPVLQMKYDDNLKAGDAPARQRIEAVSGTETVRVP